MVRAAAEHGRAAAALAAALPRAQWDGAAWAEGGGAVRGGGDRDGAAAEPDDGGDGEEEAVDGDEAGHAAADKVESRLAAHPLVHLFDVIGVGGVRWAGFRPPAHEECQLLRPFGVVAEVRDELDRALRRGELVDCGGDGGDGGAGGRGVGARAEGGVAFDGGRCELRLGGRDALLPCSYVFRERLGEEAVDGRADRRVDERPHQARPLLADAEGAAPFELACDGVQLRE